MESSGFGLVIWLSRIVGIAPYPWQSGQHQLVKILVNLYGFLLITGISVCMLTISLLRVLIVSTWMPAYNIMHNCCEIAVLTIIVIGGYSSLRRMKLMNGIIKQLEQIEAKFSCRRIYIDINKVSCRNLQIIFISYIIGCAVLRLIYCIELYKSEDSILIVLQYWIKHYLVVVIEMQLAAFAGRILITLQIINQNLLNLLPHQSFANEDKTVELQHKRKIAWAETAIDDVKNSVSDFNSTNVPVNARHQFIIETVQINEEEGIENKIRDLSTSYMKIVDLVEEWITADGLLIIILLFNHMVYFEWLSFSLIEFMFAPKDELVILATLKSCVLASHILGLMLFIEPFHRTHVQAERTRLLVQFLMVPYRECKPVTNELELFMRMMILQRMTYSPLDLITLKRPLLIKIFSSLITYLIISLTYGTYQKAE